MREPLKLDHGDTYERPNQPWVCGLADEGPTCPLGPTVSGGCSHAFACHPVRDGDRWICNRSMRNWPHPQWRMLSAIFLFPLAVVAIEARTVCLGLDARNTRWIMHNHEQQLAE